MLVRTLAFRNAIVADAGITKVTELTFLLAAGGGSETKNFPVSLNEGDLALVLLCADNAINETAVMTTGYTVDDSAVGDTPGRYTAYKVMGATPDTDVEIDQSSSQVIAGLLRVYRGVDPTTPLDASSTITSGSTGMPDPPNSSTPTVANCLALACGFLDDDDIESSVTAPTGYADVLAKDTEVAGGSGATVMIASKLLPTAAADNPAAFGGTGDDQWRARTMLLRPAT